MTDKTDHKSFSDEFFGAASSPARANMQRRVFRYMGVLLALNLLIHFAR